jgi:putative membrane protein
MPNLLVLCVDRDNDIGRKTGIKTPVIGRKANLDAATRLALTDPGESDANAIFQAIRTYDELRSKHKDAEIAAITGDVHVGVQSDEKLHKQLRTVLKRTAAKKVILISDGAEDEFIIPIIQNYTKILSVHRVVIKQSEKLKGAYYMVYDFLQRIINDPKTARLVLGIPAVALLLYSVFGAAAWRLILGSVAIYMLIKGFQLEGAVAQILKEIRLAFSSRRIGFFLYIISTILVALALKSGWDTASMLGTTVLFERSVAFVMGSIYLFCIATVTALVGKIITEYKKRKGLMRYVIFGSMAVGTSAVGYEAASVILNPAIGLVRLFASMVFGIVLISTTLTIEKLFKK